MAIDLDVPFYGNTDDDKHCGQATLRSIRKYFEPGLELSWQEIDDAVLNPRGTGTWRMAGMLWMKAHGYEVCNVEMLEYEEFSRHGLDYVRQYFGPEVAAWEEIYFDIPFEQERARYFIQEIATAKRIPALQDIRDYLARGYLVNVTMNVNLLNGLRGFVGHSLLVKGYRDNCFIAHDPGLPPQPSRMIPDKIFEAAWNNGRVAARTLTAFKK